MEFKILLLATFATNVAGLPHVGMLETPTVHDVGLFFDQSNYNGMSTFLVETKNVPTCIPINVNATGHAQGLQIKSVQVCKPTRCAFFTEEKCNAHSTGVFSVSCAGPGDLPNHESNKLFKSYICGKDLTKVVGVEGSVSLSMDPHDPNAGMV